MLCIKELKFKRQSFYSEEKAKLLRSVSSSIEEKDADLISFMQSLKLDYLHPHEDLNSLPEVNFNL